jgi:hypothetical protein
MRETEVILKGLLFNIRQCETVEDAATVIENMLTADEIAGVNEKLKEVAERKNKK